MEELGDVAVFVRVVEAGSFSAAARAMWMPKSSVSRRVARLENRLGVRLLHRTTRSLALTDAGRAYHARVSVALAELDSAAGAAADSREAPRGVVRLAARPDVGVEVLPELVAAFLTRYPEVRVEVELSVSADLVEGGFDLALRAGPGGRGSTRLQDTRFRLYASPVYLARKGIPQRPTDLADHSCLRFGDADQWLLHGPRGEVQVPVTGPLAADDLSFVRRAAVAGVGIALLPDPAVAPSVRAGLLTSVLPDHHAEGQPLHLVVPSDRHLPSRVAVLRDFLLANFPR
ncbi:LysR family transcriptional regulator [Actinokineospora globicatena]|uniref:LysR family transcriptional regulator n=1 Tax=Actinokineospora globicatena TaxID=103729 RepID=UPI0020A47DDF|nr:LysR family transcriptional regulator [Actinokineospora globicatena]MCP2303693.1 transcriptional regulator, LysR family [Actinokineospora globicatena]GLW79169.1 LysR family transcriptional regulator [Actinokineospora globicatena]GLW86421.1 LysR family transcriptional regulator [Actinokineospora globicatena]